MWGNRKRTNMKLKCFIKIHSFPAAKHMMVVMVVVVVVVVVVIPISGCCPYAVDVYVKGKAVSSVVYLEVGNMP